MLYEEEFPVIKNKNLPTNLNLKLRKNKNCI